MSLLLDALKEAEKSRKVLDAVSDAIPTSEDYVELELDIEQPKEDNTPTKDSESTPLAASPVPLAIKPHHIQNTRIATDVFQNQQKPNNKNNALLPLLLVILFVVLIALLSLYYSFLDNTASTPPDLRQSTQHVLRAAIEPQSSATAKPSSKIALPTTEITTTVGLSTGTPQWTEQVAIADTSQQNLLSTATQQTSRTVINKEKKIAFDTNNRIPSLNNKSNRSSKNDRQRQPVNRGIQVTKKRLSDRNHAALSLAVQALNQGDLKAAKRAYRKVLQQAPDNTIAMMGLANVLAQQGMLSKSQALYFEVLNKEQGNLQAKIGLINIEASDPLRLSVGSQLKQLLIEHPTEAYLHVSLGDFYARRDEWPQAQSSYFEAYALDSENPDYAFNLAISLDQIGKPSIAADYYKKALQLLEERPSRFIKADAERRLNELKGSAP